MKRQAQSTLDRTYTNESALQRDVLKWLRQHERDGIKALRICDRYAKGYSDIFICVRGIFVVVELKDDSGKPTPHQLLFIEEMQRCGAIGGICRTVGEVVDLVEQAKLQAKHKAP